ncbi:hypothetical protein G4V62_13780 [Bacillaceae bacterium SIJ1]|uniref:phage baseplate protein n=1 Tax=Litoribacterium kuwaitense TaxID=1398745 RepID=UPI0013EB58E0|nr:hypothetical protein [Litoribacterium kuwaitense]NGP45964.1 hypothetical protein [Litoribacterium kuwaitense]
MASIGGVHFNVISESRNYNNEVTSHSVEDDKTITDHVKPDPISFAIEGIVTTDASTVHRDLLRLRASKTLLDYKGRSTIKNVIIERLKTDVDEKIANGFNFSMTIKQVRLARPSTVNLLPVSLKADTSDIGNAGRVQLT